MNYHINVSQQPDGSLAPNMMGEGVAVVSMNPDRTVIITFAGMNQAVVNLDETGTRALNYTLFNPAADIAVQTSVENLIRHIVTLNHSTPSLH